MEHHVGFAIKDLDKVVRFYQDVLGFIILDLGIREGVEAAAPMGMSYVKYRIFRAIPPKGDFFIQLLQFENATEEQPHNKPHTSLGFDHVGIEVDDIDAIYHRLKIHNVTPESPPITHKISGVKLLYVRDPEGNVLEFLQFPEERKKELGKQMKQLRKTQLKS
jgi:catechol 2,3-dioxygenase-like lactoylglutathione lyase family enzyme